MELWAAAFALNGIKYGYVLNISCDFKPLETQTSAPRMRSFSFLASLAALAAVVSAAPGPGHRYAGTQVIRVPAGNITQVASIDSLIARLGLSTWTAVSTPGHFVDIVVPPAQVTKFSKETSQLGVPTTIMHADLAASILKESEVPATSSVMGQ